MNPLLGRWVSADPLAVHAPGEADLNVYAYVSGLVLKATDPLGLDCQQGGGDCDDGDVEVAEEPTDETGAYGGGGASSNAEETESAGTGHEGAPSKGEAEQGGQANEEFATAMGAGLTSFGAGVACAASGICGVVALVALGGATVGYFQADQPATPGSAQEQQMNETATIGHLSAEFLGGRTAGKSSAAKAPDAADEVGEEIVDLWKGPNKTSGGDYVIAPRDFVEELDVGFEPTGYPGNGPYLGVGPAGLDEAITWGQHWGTGVVQNFRIPKSTFESLVERGVIRSDELYDPGVSVHVPAEGLREFNDALKTGPPNRIFSINPDGNVDF